MATQQTRTLGRVLIAPAVVLLFVWMIVPLAMTIYFSLQYKNLLNPGEESFAGLDNFTYFLTDPAFVTALVNTLILVGSVLLVGALTYVPALALGPVAEQLQPAAVTAAAK